MLSPLSTSGTLSILSQLDRNQRSLNESFKRLATGRRINSGKDDPAGLISSEQLAAEIRSLEAQTRSLRRVESNAYIAEGHASELSSLYRDLNGLVVASANQAGMSDAEIAATQMQIDSTVASIRRFTGDATTAMNGVNLPNGGNAEVQTLYNNALATAASVQSGGANDLSSGNFEAAQAALQQAGVDIATARGRVGAYQKNVIGPQIRSNQVAYENLSESRSRIADTDYALEMSNLGRAKVLTSAGMKLLKISQQQAKTVLSLLS